MKIKTEAQIDALMDAVHKCNHDVLLQSRFGDVYNLKSALSCYLAIAALIKDHNEDLELFCTDSTDEVNFFEFFRDNPDVLGVL